jgi:hypothetical protein
MASVERIGIAPVNFRGNDNKTQDVKTTDLKKYVTPTNVALGSLATLGVLGMADILICKGKHINKLTGKGKELEEALGRATSAETRAVEAETKITGLETKLQEMTKSKAESLEAMKNKIEEMKKELNSIHSGMSADNIKSTLLRKLSLWYTDVAEFGEESATYMRAQFKKLLSQLHCEFVEKLTPEFEDCFELSRAPKIDKIDFVNPAIIDKETQQVLVKGHVWVPENYKI